MPQDIGDMLHRRSFIQQTAGNTMAKNMDVGAVPATPLVSR